MEDFEELRAEQENDDHVGNDDEANGHKATPTDADLSIIADLYGVSVAYLRGEVDAPASNVKNAMQQQLMDSVQGLTDDEMRKVIEYVRFLKFLDAEQKADPQ